MKRLRTAKGINPWSRSPCRKPAVFFLAAEAITDWAGSAQAFQIDFGTIVTWLILGPVRGYSDTWQLTINMGTLIITFLMVFLIQKTQNRDTRAVRLKMG